MLQQPQPGQIGISGVEVRYMPPQDLVLQKSLSYIDVFSLMTTIHNLNSNPLSREWDPVNLLLNGPKGNGKSLLLATYAKENQLPYLTVECSEETRERHLKGGFVVKGGATPFVLGTVANAIQVANEVGRAMIVFEEINALSPQRQKELNALTDFRKRIEIPELSFRMELVPGAKLFIAATMNPSAYGGTYELNEDLKSRFMEIEMPYPPPEAEGFILKTAADALGNIEPHMIVKLVDIAQQTRQEGVLGYALSTRDLVDILKSVSRIGWEGGLFLIAQKFSKEDRKLVMDRIKDITKMTLDADVGERFRRLNQPRDEFA